MGQARPAREFALMSLCYDSDEVCTLECFMLVLNCLVLARRMINHHKMTTLHPGDVRRVGDNIVLLLSKFDVSNVHYLIRTFLQSPARIIV